MNKNVLLVLLIAFSCSFLFGSFFVKNNDETEDTLSRLEKKEHILNKESNQFIEEFDYEYFNPDHFIHSAIVTEEYNLSITDIKKLYASCFDQILTATKDHLNEPKLINYYLSFCKKELSTLSQILPQSDWISLTRVNNHLNSSIVSYRENNNEELLRSLTRLRNSFELQMKPTGSLVKQP